MRNKLVHLVAGALRTLLGRTIAFICAVCAGELIGILIAAKQHSTLASIAADIPFVLFSPLVSFKVSLLVFGLLVTLFVYLRFETPHWLLVLAVLLAGTQGYLVESEIRPGMS